MAILSTATIRRTLTSQAGQRLLDFFQSTTINVLKLTYYATKDLTLKLFFQANSAIKKTNIHVMCLYNLRSVGTIQLVYQKGTAAFGVKGTQDHTLFVKWSRKF